MPGASDYFWNANDSFAPIVAGASGAFSSATIVQKNDGYGGSNWSFSAGMLTVHVHFEGASRRVSVVRIKSHDGTNYDENIIKLAPGAKGVNLRGLAKYAAGFPNHVAMLDKLAGAMPP